MAFGIWRIFVSLESNFLQIVTSERTQGDTGLCNDHDTESESLLILTRVLSSEHRAIP